MSGEEVREVCIRQEREVRGSRRGDKGRLGQRQAGADGGPWRLEKGLGLYEKVSGKL